jgi:hypothetical protein
VLSSEELDEVAEVDEACLEDALIDEQGQLVVQAVDPAVAHGEEVDGLGDLVSHVADHAVENLVIELASHRTRLPDPPDCRHRR